MAHLDINEIKEEIIVKLRNADIITTATRGVTSTTQLFGGDNVTKNFVLSNTPVRNVRNVTIVSTAQSLGSDYDVDYSTATITFATPPAATGTNNISIVYDYGDSDKIFPDFPRNDLSISSFPRIGADILGFDTEPGGFGNVDKTNVDFTVVVYDINSKDLADKITRIRSAVSSVTTSFGRLNDVRPKSIGPVIKSPFEKGKDKIIQQNADFRSYWNWEIN